jgi:2-dehydropantoate 2-reductase
MFMPRILVVGGGAIGGITAAQMQCDVMVLDANAEHIARLRDPGLVYEQEGVGHTVRLDAVTSIDELNGDFDFALIAVKSPLHREVLEPLVVRGGIETFVSLGNGLIQDLMEGIVGKGNLLACIVEWGGSNLGPGRLVRDSLGGYMIGELDGSDSERSRVLARCLEPVGPVRITSNVRGMIWSKLLINSTFTGLSAVSGLRYGGVAEQGRDAIFALWGEGMAVAEAQGLKLESVHVNPYRFDDAALVEYMKESGNVRPSMLQDLDVGRLTEVDVVNGGVVSRGRELDVQTPCNDRVVELVHSMERGERFPESRWLAYVSEAQATSQTLSR